MDDRLLPEPTLGVDLRRLTLSQLERSTGLSLPADAMRLLVDFAGGAVGLEGAEVVIPSFKTPRYELLSELMVLEVPSGEWVEAFRDFDGLRQDMNPGLPAQARLMRSVPFLADHREWGSSLIPIMHTHSERLNGLVCLDFFELEEAPPVIMFAKGEWDEPSSPTWRGMWYLAPSVTKLLHESRLQSFDKESGAFPFEIDGIDREPSLAELAWNRRRDERLGRL